MFINEEFLIATREVFAKNTGGSSKIFDYKNGNCCLLGAGMAVLQGITEIPVFETGEKYRIDYNSEEYYELADFLQVEADRLNVDYHELAERDDPTEALAFMDTAIEKVRSERA